MDETNLLHELIQEREKLKPFIQVLPHCAKLLDAEIEKLETKLKPQTTNIKSRSMKKTCKVVIPVDTYPNYNFVGKILGPRGAYLQKIEKKTHCKLFIRGRGSMRDKRLEEGLRGKQGYENLNEPLHILIEAEAPSEDLLEKKISECKQVIAPLLVPVEGSKDVLKKRQLKELALLKASEHAPFLTPLTSHLTNDVPSQTLMNSYYSRNSWETSPTTHQANYPYSVPTPDRKSVV